MTEDETLHAPATRPISRRTVALGTAWAVPAIAVAAAAPAFATSGNSWDPVIDFGRACGNTGDTRKGCGGKDKTLQVPVTVTNQTGGTIAFQITSMYTCNCDTAPTGPGTGVYSGVTGMWRTNGNHDDCQVPFYTLCGGGVPFGGVQIPNNTTRQFWIVSAQCGNASKFSTTINWRMLKADCTELSSGKSATVKAISSQNC